MISLFGAGNFGGMSFVRKARDAVDLKVVIVANVLEDICMKYRSGEGGMKLSLQESKRIQLEILGGYRSGCGALV